MSATRIATLDGTWELHPMLVLQPVEPHVGTGFTIDFEDVARLVEMVDDDLVLAEDGFRVLLSNDGTPESMIEFPPGEPSRNAIAAMRWFADAMFAAGPMPATNE